VARILIVGGGCSGRQLAQRLLAGGHAVRITTRTEQGRAAIEQTGAECWVGTPDRLETLRGSLDRVAVACWLLAAAEGDGEALAALHTTRLELFLTQAIDTTVRGFLYEAPAGAQGPVADGKRIALALTERNAIPARILSEDRADQPAWQAAAMAAIGSFLGEPAAA